MAENGSFDENDIAIVGMAAHLTGARNIREYWDNLRNGVESIVPLTDEELLANGESPENLRKPNYVKAAGPLPDMEMFDGEFFGFSPKESAILDPQHRHFLEASWEALENAGHPPEKFDGSIGLFGGCGMGSYFYFNLCTNKDLVDSVGLFLLRHTGNDKDFLVTRVSYLLDLKGPSINVQTACSTSLVAVHLACQSLLSGECDMALAGGVTIEIPHQRGYFYHEGEVLSPDGHCHAFDHRGQGTVFGSGAGVVVLRRLKDAIADGDYIHAIIKGTTVNNDGAAKVGYLAPSVDGQAAAMAEAHAVAGITADSIGYIECHGTGTYMGDPIEIAALTEAFRQTTDKKQFCRIGSVKTNIGHLDTAAGVASLIKAALVLTHKQIPPSLNFEKPNPTIDFENSPFIVNDKLYDWKLSNGPRRAAVNSLGVGGTNAHAVLQEAPKRPASSPAKREYQLLTFSARSKRSLEDYQKKLAAHLAESNDNLADVAWTLHHGRRAFEHRRVVAAKDREEAARLLEQNDPQRVFTHSAGDDKSTVTFMFPGGGSQYPRMGADLYRSEPVFKEHLDKGLDALQKKSGIDFRALLFPSDADFEAVQKKLEEPHVQLPAIFIVSYALAKLWMSWGIQPNAMIGHSVGENVAACLAGVFSFDDALGLVLLRGRLVEKVAGGGMLSVPMASSQLQPLLDELDLDLAIVNSPELCVASGSAAGIDALEQKLLAREIEPRRLKITVAGHSRMLDPILKEFGDYLRSIKLSAPAIPFVSNYTGAWITKEQATDPEYWVKHLRNTVRFADGAKTLLETSGRVYLEVGPGRILSSLIRQHPDAKQGLASISSLRHPDEKTSDVAFFTTVLGRLWAAGVKLDFAPLWKGEKRQRVQLPSYAFQRQRYFIEPGKVQATEDLKNLAKVENLEDWFYRPAWKQRPADVLADQKTPQTWLFFMDDAGIGERLVQDLKRDGHTVVEVHEGDAYARRSETHYVLSPEHGREGYDRLVRDLMSSGKVPNRIVHLWLVTATEKFRPGSSFFHRNVERGFYSLFFLAQAMGDENVPRPIHVTVGTTGMQQVSGEGLPYPEKATVLGPVKVMPRELPGVTVSVVDLVLPRTHGLLGRIPRDPRELLRAGIGRNGHGPDPLLAELHKEIFLEPKNSVVALRENGRYEQEIEKRRPSADGAENAIERLKPRGVYVITGGLGGLGLVMADFLAQRCQARLVLLGRTPLPEREEWDAWVRRLGDDHPTSKRIARIRALEAAGAEVMIGAADVTDVDAMREVVARAKERFGAINGVIHTAGVVKDDLIQLKSMADVEDVFTPKLHGTVVLDSVFAGENLDFMVLFSSTSTVIAPAGQVDYVAANAFLNAYAESKPNVFAVGWGIWNQVGMAAEALSGDRAKKIGAKDERPTSHPLFDLRVKDAHDKTVLTGRYSPETHWLLGEHRTLAGHALIPGTGYLELARAALEEYGEVRPFEIEDLFFFRPLHVSDTEPKDVRVRLARSEGGYSFEVRSRRQVEGQWGWELHAQASLQLTPLPPAQTVDVQAVIERCGLHRTPEDPSGLRSKQEQHLRFGPRWRVLRQANYGKSEAIARLELPEAFLGDLEHYGLHPALLDLATGYAMSLIEGYDQDSSSLWVPVSYKRVRVRDRLPWRVYSWVKNHGKNSTHSDFAAFDVVLCDEHGRVVMEVEEFTIKRISGDVDFAVASVPSSKDIELEARVGSDGARQLSPAELQLQRNLERGILPAEGQEALARILSGPRRPQVFVSSMELPKLMQQAEATQAESTDSSTKFARPELDSEYIAPRDEVERTLVGFWEELLGVDKVGVGDSFFDLGGHSLIAVRLFAMIKKAYHVDYPISVLFEAPTISRCATMIKEAIGHQEGASNGAADGETPAPKQVTVHKPRFTHLVPMHPGEGGPRTPFFLVAGMFGNVLNLRHLAHLLGTDRPLYGLQARGLYGDHKPHETFEEMARDYLAEVRQVQPHGPYFLGGFSGGGITAYEMAQQLLAEGEEVALVVMLDSRLPQSPPITKKDKAVIHWQRLQKKGPDYLKEWAESRYNWEVGKLKKRFGKEIERGETEFHNEEIEAAFRRALTRYDVKPYPGKITLFRPKLDKAHVLGPNRVLSSELEFVYHDNDWGRFVGGIEVNEVPGNHDSMVLEPNVRVMASRLRAAIEKAEGEIKQRTRAAAIARAQGNGPGPGRIEPDREPASAAAP